VASDAEKWQLEGPAPELYERYLVPAVTLPWAQDLVERVGVAGGDHVLDLACGTGVVARVVSERVGGAGRVVGLDVNSGMLEVARAAAPEIEWVEGSALALPFDGGEFGIVVCQLGLQFFDDRLGALREMHRVLDHRGRVAASVFTSIDRNPAALALSDALDRHVGDGASVAKRSEHSLADSEELQGLCAAAGFSSTRVETVRLTVRFSSVEEWVGIQLAATPLAAVAQREDVLARVTGDVAESLDEFVDSDGFAFPQEVHVAIATV
jgi:ubiquinone/menaquinone biosynthesis C-methylase UbiE